jgi:hypothetical protein
LRIDTGIMPGDRDDGVELLDEGFVEEGSGAGAEIVRLCAPDFEGMVRRGLGRETGDGGPGEVGISPRTPWCLRGSGKSAK